MLTYSKSFENILERCRFLLIVPEDLRIFYNVPDGSKMFQNVIKSREFCEMVLNVFDIFKKRIGMFE